MKRRVNRPSLDLLIKKKELVGVEIGVQFGLNAEWMLKNLDIKKLYLVDPYDKYPSNNPKQTITGPFPDTKKEALERLDSYKDKIEWIYKYSWDALDMFNSQSLDFIYIDGDHRGKAIYKDLQYIKKVKFGGLLCGHDWRFQSIKSVIEKFIKESRLKFNCCKTDQFVQTVGKHADGCDWWIPIFEANHKFQVKCQFCQKSFALSTDNVEWLK